MGKLSAVIEFADNETQRIFLYGTPGVGKSTFAAAFPDPIVFTPEDGLNQIRRPNGERLKGFIPSSFDDLLEYVNALSVEDHDYKTVVFDTLGDVQQLIFSHVLKSAGKEDGDIKDIAWGRGYDAAVDHVRSLLSRLDHLRKVRKMSCVMLAHSVKRLVKNPEGEDYEAYEPDLQTKVAGTIMKWSDAVLFAKDKVYVHKDDKKRVRAFSKGERVIHTESRGSWVAKNRYGLPAEMLLDYPAYCKAVEFGRVDPASLREQISAIAAKMSDERRAKVDEAVARAGNDSKRLASLLDLARKRLEEEIEGNV